MVSMTLMTLCYVKSKGMTLMMHRTEEGDYQLGKWNGLGGKFEKGESPEDCVIREVKEESNLDIKNPKLVGILCFTGFMNEDWYVFAFTATEFTGEIKSSKEGKLEWIADEKIFDLNLWPSDHYFIKWIQEGKFFSANFRYDWDEFIDYDVVFY